MHLESTIKEFIVTELDPGRGTLDVDDELLDSGILDSLSLIQLLAFLETKLSAKIGAEELTSQNFRTIKRIARLIERKELTL